ncbi:MAG: YqhA family protein [Xanthobacteraceae bacterium]
MRPTERAFETLIFFCRWLAAPFLIGLVGGLLLLLYRFFADLVTLATHVAGQGWHELVVGVLDLVDVALTANLILIVIFSSYENFIRKVEPGEHPDWPAGLIDINFLALKQRLLASIAVIAAVEALAWYLDLEHTTDLTKLGWAIAFPLLFFVALVLLAIADRLGRNGRNGEP